MLNGDWWELGSFMRSQNGGHKSSAKGVTIIEGFHCIYSKAKMRRKVKQVLTVVNVSGILCV